MWEYNMKKKKGSHNISKVHAIENDLRKCICFCIKFLFLSAINIDFPAND